MVLSEPRFITERSEKKGEAPGGGATLEIIYCKPLRGPPTLLWTLDLWPGTFDLGPLAMVLGCRRAQFTQYVIDFLYVFMWCVYLLFFSNVLFGLGGLSGGAWGRLGHPWGATWAPSEHLVGAMEQVKSENVNTWCGLVMWFWKLSYFIVLKMLWRVLESRIWSWGRLGFENCDMSLVLLCMFTIGQIAWACNYKTLVVRGSDI